MPTRVLEICNGDSDTPQTVRLISSNEKTERYVALSYAWGIEPFLRTTTENVQDMQAELSASSLPQTLRDAITVTAWLGLKYIWIDSLCILQDSAEDKDTEISSMANVYSHAFLTISATNAAGVYDGFLQAKAGDHPSTILPFPCPDGRLGSIRVRPSGWYKSLAEPLNRRAWAMQERLLSPRLLEFTSLGVSWKCRSETINQEDTQGVPFFRGKEANWISWAIHCDTTKGQWDIDGALEVWDWILKHYTVRRLTYEADKLPALGGIAQEMQRIIGGKYAAGLWRDYLHRGLLWSGNASEEREDGRRLLKRPAGSTVPTWSWASVEGSVISRDIAADEEKQFTIQIERCEYILSSNIQPFRSVDWGKMTVLAHSGWAVLEEKQEYFGQTISTGGNIMTIWPDDTDQFQQAIENNQVFIIEVALHWDLLLATWKSRGLILRVGEPCTRVGYHEEMVCSDEFHVFDREKMSRLEII